MTTIESLSEGKNELSELRTSENKNSTSQLDGHETNRTDVKMRGSSVRPSTGGDNEDNQEKDKDTDKPTDSSDGYDALSAESLGPLLSSNQYSMRKIAAQALMDVALMMANISQLRTLLAAGNAMEYFAVLVAMVVLSLSLQVLFAVVIFIIWMRENDQHQKEEYLKTFREVVEATKGGTIAEKIKARNSLLMKRKTFEENRVTSHLNYITMVIVFIITVINMFITGFGIKLEVTTGGDNKTTA